jgi:phage/plasmid-like protein (TIGR03299 family)
MAHEIMENDGAVFNRVAAWHRLGTVVDSDLSPTEALKAAGLDWNVIKTGFVKAEHPDIGTVFSEDYSAIVRQDTQEILSVQSDDYQVIQNSEHFEMAYELSKDVKVESALSLKNGRKVVLLLRGDTFDVAGSSGDTVTEYMGLINSHDGSIAFSALPTSVRIVCQNTLSMAIAKARKGKNMFRITHKGTTMEDKKEAMRDALREFKSSGKFFRETVDTLANYELTKTDIQKFWMDVWGMIEAPIVSNPTTDAEKSNYDNALKAVSSWSETFDRERDETKSKASVWMAANAVSKFIQHRVAARGRKASIENRAWDNLAGLNQDSTMKVFRHALTLV